jgi:hypothetical protein
MRKPDFSLGAGGKFFPGFSKSKKRHSERSEESLYFAFIFATF